MQTRSRFYRFLTYLLFIIGWFGTAWLSYNIKSDIEDDEYQKFERRCEQIKSAITAKMYAHKQLLLGGAALFDASEDVTRHEWHQYVNRLQLDQHFQGIQGLGFAQYIIPKDVAKNIHQIRSEGFHDFNINPIGERSEYTSIIYLEPFSGRNLRAFGYDMYTESVRKAAMVRACEENSVTLSGKVTLVQETDKNIQAGTLMYAPVYYKNKPLRTADERYHAIFGWVYSPFRMGDFLSNIVTIKENEQGAHTVLSVYDGDTTQKDSLLYTNDTSLIPTEIAPSITAKNVLANYKTTLDFNGTRWTLYFEQVAQLNEKLIDYSKAWFTSLTGIIINFLLFLLLNSYLNTREKAHIIATQLTLQLKQSEHRFRDLFENAPLPYQSIDVEGKLISVNTAWMNLINPPKYRMIGECFADLLTPPSKLQFENIFRELKKNGHITSPILELSTQNESESILVILEGHAAYNSQDELQQIHCILIDITERHRFEKSLKESEARFRLLADYAPVLIWLANLDGCYVYFNKTWLEFTGHTLAEEQNNQWTKGIHENDISRYSQIYQHAFNSQQPFKMEYRLRRYDGQYRWILNEGIPRFAEDRLFLGFVGSCIDITERYEMEQELKTTEENIRRINYDLQQFTYVAAHHLQEPTRRIVNFAQRLEAQLDHERLINQEIQTTLRFIIESAIRQRALVRDIQLYLAADQPVSEQENVDTHEIIAKILADRSNLIHTLNATVNYNNLPPVYIDRPRLREIFDILIENCLHYAKKDALIINISGHSEGDRVIFCVADNGVGIKTEYHQRVLLVFERLQANENQESTGIGLAVVRRIIEHCNGSIYLKETEGGGLSVIFDLPKALSTPQSLNTPST